ncbi:LytTR family DNA-binding domain-containing protein [Antarctobacter jejuensis]|uniref:LytTR family DNA-binding domain-containing protein n=1 Tax=Antarctobacter jejuensis TaxID=1439938 RepID=UPI003FD51BD2
MSYKPMQVLTFFDILGGRFTLAPKELVSLMRNRTTLTYLGLVYVLLIVTDVPDLRDRVALPVILTAWALLMVVFHAAVWLVISIVAGLQRQFGPRVWPGPVIVLGSLPPAILAGQAVVYLGTAGRVVVPILPSLFYYWLIAELFGLIYFRYVRFHVDGRTGDVQPRTDAPPPAIPEERHIVIGTQPVPLSRLHHIEAHEHHVLITMDGQSITHRGRLSDIVAQTGPDDGLQPHRSWWVSANAARDLTREGQRHLLQLDDGTRVPVARTRLDQVRDWLERRD